MSLSFVHESCHNTKVINSEFTEVARVNLVELPIDSTLYTKIVFNHKLVELDDSVYLYYSWDNQFFYKNLTSGDTKLIPFNWLNKTPIDYLFYKRGQVALLYDEYIILWNTKTNDTCHIRFKYDNVDIDSEEIVVQSYPNYEFIYFENTFYIPVAYKLWANDKDKLRNYYSLPVTLAVNEQNFESTLFGCWPSNYMEGNYFGDFFYHLTGGANGSLVYSFRASDSLLIYDNYQKGVTKKCPTKQIIHMIPFPLEDISNFGMIKKYNIESPRFEKIIYDPYYKKYYRVYKPKCTYNNEDNMFRNASEMEWSIMILNEQFEIIRELKVEPKQYSFFKMYCIHGNLWVIQEVEELIKRKEIIYSKLTK